ncbi:PorT family protein [Paracnuella aquatica]|nr:PorT family protein [Paracnuella aquatica]
MLFTMYKNASLLTALLLIVNFVFGQSYSGLKAGINYANQLAVAKPANTFDNKPIVGVQAGVFFKNALTQKWTLAAEANFSIIGASYRFLELVKPNDQSSNLFRIIRCTKQVAYLELPLMMQYNCTNFYFGAGPAAALKLYSTPDEQEFPPSYKTIDVSANAIAGYKLSKKMDVNVRYSYGLINTLKDRSNFGILQEVRINNRFANISLLYRLK